MTDEEIRANIGNELRTRDGRIAVVLGEVPVPRIGEQWIGYIVTPDGTCRNESWFSGGAYACDGEGLNDLMPAPPQEMWVNVYEKTLTGRYYSGGGIFHTAEEAREKAMVISWQMDAYIGPHRLVPEGGE